MCLKKMSSLKTAYTTEIKYLTCVSCGNTMLKKPLNNISFTFFKIADIYNMLCHTSQTPVAKWSMYSLLQMSSRAQKNLIFEKFSEERLIYDLVRKHVKIYSLSKESATMKNLSELIAFFFKLIWQLFCNKPFVYKYFNLDTGFCEICHNRFKCPSFWNMCGNIFKKFYSRTLCWHHKHMHVTLLM